MTYEYYRGVFNDLVYRIDLNDNVQVYHDHQTGWTTSWGDLMGGFADRLRSSWTYAPLDGEPVDVIG